MLAFFAKKGCNSRSTERVQKLGDTEVPTASLKRLQQSVSQLRTDIRKVPLDGSISTRDAEKALADVSFIEIPPSAKP